MISTLRKGNTHGSYLMPLMCCEWKTTRDCPYRPTVRGRSLGIFLKWVGGTTYVRANCTELKSMQPRDLEQGPGQDEFYLAPSVEQLHHSVDDLRSGSIHLPHPSELSIPGTELRIRNTKVSPGFMWDREQRIFYTYGHQSPVGCASYELSGRSGVLFIAFFGLHYNSVPWLCLAGPNSSLLPSYVERRPDFLKRAEVVAKKLCRTKIVIDLADNIEESTHRWLTVEGCLSMTSCQKVQGHRVHLSMWLDSGPAQSSTQEWYRRSSTISEFDDSDKNHMIVYNPIAEICPPPTEKPPWQDDSSTLTNVSLRSRL